MILLALLVSIIGLVSSTVYLILVIKSARQFRRDRRDSIASGISMPFVTVLKPLHGLEPHLERNLESFYMQEYPNFEIIFGTRTSSDPALEIVERLQRKHPHVKTRIVLSGEA